MARKRHTGEQELPFVALMDTMTNVVGVLTIVLVMMGISLGRAASRVFSSLPPATEEQIRAAQAELDRMRAEQAPFQDKLKTLNAAELDSLKLAALDVELARLERDIQQSGAQTANLDALSQERAKREAELQQKKAAMDQRMSERDRLKALLDKTPASKAAPAKIVRIPASRPIPEGATIEEIFVTDQGAYWMNAKGTKAFFLNRFKLPSVRAMVQSRVKRDNKTVLIYDYEKLVQYFRSQKLAFRGFKIDVTWGRSSSPVLRMVPEGPPAEPVLEALKEIRRTPNSVVIFRVTAAGFENYLAARKDCDTVGVPAGWEYVTLPEYSISVPEIETNKPAPPSPPPSSQPAPPPRPSSELEIKAPGRKLD
jgi:hypothetical protein